MHLPPLSRIRIVRGDMTKQTVDAIVNAANTTLLGGVDGAIHDAAGPELLAECRTLGSCATGDAKITRGYRLRAKWVIDTVGPIWYGGNCGENELLATYYRRCFELVREHRIRSVAFPAISTGAYGFPHDRAAAIAVDQVKQSLAENNHVEQVVLVGFDSRTCETYRGLVARAIDRKS